MFSTILLAFISFKILVPVAAFIGIGAMAWFLLDHFGASGSKAEDRLDEFRDPSLRKRREEIQAGKGPDTVTRVLEAATPALAKPLQPKNEKEAGDLKQLLSEAGFRSELAPQIFLGMQFLGLLLGMFISGGVLLFSSKWDSSLLIKCVATAGIMFYLPKFGLMFMASGRKEKIFLGLPDALDLMVVCVEAGLGLDQAMRKVAEEMKKSHIVIGEEFSLCTMQSQMGRTRSQVLQDLGIRNGVDDLRSLASILIQADKFGSSVAQALRVQSEAMRTRRKQIAEEKAAKTAVKLIFPLVIFIFPGIFVVLVGPAAITMIREMFPAMSGG